MRQSRSWLALGCLIIAACVDDAVQPNFEPPTDITPFSAGAGVSGAALIRCEAKECEPELLVQRPGSFHLAGYIC